MVWSFHSIKYSGEQYFLLQTLDGEELSNLVNGRFLKKIYSFWRKKIWFSLYIPMCEGLNKYSISQWIFCRKIDSFSYNTKGTDLQVLEASQGGLHPAAGAICYSLFLFSIFESFSCLKNMIFLIVLKFWPWFLLKYFNFRLMFIVDLIGFIFNFDFT